MLEGRHMDAVQSESKASMHSLPTDERRRRLATPLAGPTATRIQEGLCDCSWFEAKPTCSNIDTYYLITVRLSHRGGRAQTTWVAGVYEGSL